MPMQRDSSLHATELDFFWLRYLYTERHTLNKNNKPSILVRTLTVRDHLCFKRKPKNTNSTVATIVNEVVFPCQIHLHAVVSAKNFLKKPWRGNDGSLPICCHLFVVLPSPFRFVKETTLFCPLTEIKRVKRNRKKIVVYSACDVTLGSLLTNSDRIKSNESSVSFLGFI